MKKACSIFLILMLVICTMAPMAALADENDGTQTQDPGQSQQQQQDTGGQSQGGQSQQQDTGGQSQGGQGQQQNTGGQNQGGQSSGGSSSQDDSSGTKNDNDDKKKDDDSSKNDQKTTEDRSAVTMKKKQNTENPNGEVSIIFTGDIHSHLDSQNEIGGFAKMKTQIDDIEKTYPDTFLFDAGGFSMGTAFQTIYTSAASELRMMGQLDYDAVTLGDHEFDYRVGGLGRMLNKAAESKRIITTSKTVLNKSTWRRQTIVEENQFMPEIVCANINWEKTLADKDFEQTGRFLRKTMKNYGVCDYTVIDKGGVRVAVFGLMGEDAVSSISTSGVKWDNYIERAKAVVGEIKRNKEADIIVCLSHSGYSAEEGAKSEDAQLAENLKAYTAEADWKVKSDIAAKGALLFVWEHNEKNRPINNYSNLQGEFRIRGITMVGNGPVNDTSYIGKQKSLYKDTYAIIGGTQFGYLIYGTVKFEQPVTALEDGSGYYCVLKAEIEAYSMKDGSKLYSSVTSYESKGKNWNECVSKGKDKLSELIVSDIIYGL